MLSKETLELIEQYSTMANQLLELHAKIATAIEEETGSVRMLKMDPAHLHLWSLDDTREDVLALATSTSEEAREFIGFDGPVKDIKFFIGSAECHTIVKEAQ